MTNQSDTPLNGWTLEFEYEGKITQVWNAEIVSQNGNTYTIRNADYNGTVAPDQEVSIGFLGEGSVSDEPSVFELNG
ncbi:cellulose binding domain-containing protein, partial [Hyella patelloides]|uniref:cellulose binding domain-containing protein n=1 Tax=Hyella patelloides TaxID=1982969 RepID=UPI003CCC47A4